MIAQNGNPGPVAEAARITGLDLTRGVAVLGILLMNAVHFRYGAAPYLNLSAGGSATWLDWTIGIGGEIFIDQKFMGLFSLLFGAGVMLFIDRAETRAGRPVLLNLWRNALLLAIGIAHTLIWEGDVLTVYAVASVFLIAMRKLAPRTLIAAGVLIFLLSVPIGLLAQYLTDAGAMPLAGVWLPADPATANAAGKSDVWLLLPLAGYFLRGLGLILMGAGLYRAGFMRGALPARTYRLIAAAGLSVGLPLAAAGVAITARADYAPAVAFAGQLPNTIGTIPASLGYLCLIILWNRNGDSRLKQWLQAVGRMALTNYLAQTALGILILGILLADVPVNRTGILAFCAAVWALQLWWSPAWLSRFRYGPAEWLWRAATYRRRQPLRRA